MFGEDIEAIKPVKEPIFFKNIIEMRSKEEWTHIPLVSNGIYVLYNETTTGTFLVYVGIARGEKTGFKSRIKKHRYNTKKVGKWTHFSLYEFRDGHRDTIVELEAFLLHIYANDSTANSLNKVRKTKRFQSVTRKEFWVSDKPTALHDHS